jgi:hypothetical protein
MDMFYPFLCLKCVISHKNDTKYVIVGIYTKICRHFYIRISKNYIDMYKSILLIVLTIFLISSCREKIEGTGFDEPYNPQQAVPEAWEDVEPGFNAAFGSIDERYEYHLPPQHAPSYSWEGTAWQGERKNIQLMLWSREAVDNIEVKDFELKGPGGEIISRENIKIHPVRYVLTDLFLSGCGRRYKDTIPFFLAAEKLENILSMFSHENITRPAAAYWLNQGKDQFDELISLHFRTNKITINETNNN